MSLAASVQAAVEHVTDPRDAGTVQLALTYAERVDHGGELEKLGPALLAALEALQLSPRSRKAAMTGAKPANALDQLADRRAGKGRAANLHAATP